MNKAQSFHYSNSAHSCFAQRGLIRIRVSRAAEFFIYYCEVEEMSLAGPVTGTLVKLLPATLSIDLAVP